MTEINELRAGIKNAENMMRKYPENPDFVEACKWRIEENLREIARIKGNK